VVAALLPLDARAAPPSDGNEFQRGVCYAHSWGLLGREGYGSATSARTVARLRELGVGWLSLTPFGYMVSPTSDEIRFGDAPGSETDERLATEARRAHALGMKVALKPHVWVHRGEWQGDLRWASDDDFRRWFASYFRFIRHHALLAARERFDLLVIGTELKSATARDPAAWRALIGEVRKIYRGPITYAANWDEAEHVAFWDALDLVGVQAYAPIAARPSPSLEELRAGWRKVAADLAALARRTNKRILFTELGYRATASAGLAPSTWPEADGGARYDGAHQADCYRAAFEAIGDQPWVAGVHVWKWFTDSRDESGPTDFSPAGKPAESVLREFYQRKRTARRDGPH
jgi:hypothetical protein